VRRSWKIGLAAAVLLAAAVALLAAFRIQLIEALARRELASLGFADATLRVEAAGLSAARVADLALGPGARAIAIRLHYGLLPPRLARVEIDGLFVDLSQLDRRLLDKLGGAGEGGGAMPEIVLNDGRVEADMPQGRATIALSGSYGPTGGRAAGEFRVEGFAHGRFSVALSGPLAGPYDFEGEVLEAAVSGRRIQRLTAKGAMQIEEDAAAMDGELAIAAEAATARLPFAARIEPARVVVQVEKGEAASPERNLAAQGLSAMLTLAERAEFRVAAKTVTTGYTAPFSLEVSAEEAGESFAFELTAKAAGATLSGRGEHDPSTGKGKAQLTLRPVRFAPGGLQPAALIPELAAIENVSGAVGGEATLSWGAALGSAGELRLDDVSFEVAGIAVEGLAGALRLAELAPPMTADRQLLRARRITAGAALEDVSLKFRLDGAAKTLEIGRLQADFAGGRLVVANARLRPTGRNPLVVQLHDVNLAALLAMVGLQGLSGQGRVSGALPLIVTADDVLVEGGEIFATGPGRLSFRSEEAKQALAAGGEYVDLALQALEDFRYEKLSLTIDKAEGGHAVVRLSTLGANPAVLDRQPFAINVTLNADANALFAQALEAWRLSQGALATIVRGR
jgi:hypothetical protein